MLTRSGRYWVTALAWLAIIPTAAAVELPAVLGDGMMIQRDRPVRLWGWSSSGATVSIEPSWGAPVSALADAQGAWSTRLDAPEAGGPYTIRYADDASSRTVQEILCGEVWLCSGQSNMQFSMRQADGGREAAEAADLPQIRLFQVPMKHSLDAPRDVEAAWEICSPRTVGGFSAAAFFFGRKLHEELNVPIGLIHSSYGGTPVESWISPEVINELNETRDNAEWLRLIRTDPAALAQRDERIRREFSEQLEERVREGGRENLPPANWKEFDFTADWPSTKLPVSFEESGIAGLADFDGAVYYRRTIELGPAWKGGDLMLGLGPIDDMDTVWFNGTRIGGIEVRARRNSEIDRRYRVPAELVRSGGNVIAMRVIDSGSTGGMRGTAEQMGLWPTFADGPSTTSLAGDWAYRVGFRWEFMPRMAPLSELSAYSPTVLFQAMIRPLIPVAIRGVIWYQGEANVQNAYEYRETFPAMIRDWRERWGMGDMPFLFVQIAPFSALGFYQPPEVCSELQEAQLLAHRMVPNTGMVVVNDIGNLTDIHPRNKRDVGERLAGWALAKTYGREAVAYSGPLYREVRIENGRARVFFDHAAGLASRNGEPLVQFTIAARDRKFFPAKAEIDGESVVVWSDEVIEPVAVRLGWGNEGIPNLINASGLPTSIFRTDDWPGVTYGRP